MTIQQQIDALKKEFENKIAELEKQAKAEEKQSKVWKPKEDELCWVIFSNGIDNVCARDTELHNKAYLRGNIVKTKKEAEWRDQHRVVAFELECFVKENDPRPITDEDWENAKRYKYYIKYSHYDKKINYAFVLQERFANQVYASNEEVLKQAIEHVGEERLKKYYFGVE